jgi:hypothetical protein
MMDGKQRWAKQRDGKGLERSEATAQAAKCCSLCLAMEHDDLRDTILLTASRCHASNLQGDDVE